MKRTIFISIMIIIIFQSICHAGFFDNIMKGIGLSQEQGSDNAKVISGLKEALSIGTENAVKKVSMADGFLGNEAIRILMPEKIQKVADLLKKVGYQKQVDDFVASMNRAAETAADKATPIFVDAIKEMTIDDAKNILGGADTAATDYFKAKTSDRLFDEFKPAISSSMDKVGVTRNYKEMMKKYESLPYVKAESLDLDRYVTNESLDGLFYMVAQEEKKIRTDPAARVTDLLKDVFGK